MQIGVQSREARYSSFSRSSWHARHLYLPPEVSGRWYRGFMYGSKANEFPFLYSGMINRFGRPVPVLSMVTNQVVDYIYQTHEHRLTQWNNLLLNPAALQRYADAIARKGAPLENYFGFVDGTVRPICRPNENQSIVHNGHKRAHAVNFQSVTIPNGLIANLYGPVGIKAGTCIYLLIFFHQIYYRVVLCTLCALLKALTN